MKNFILSSLFFMILICGIAQNANLVIFTNEPEPFYVICNGLKMNEQPETNVKLTGLTSDWQKVKIIFKNPYYEPIEKNIPTPFGKESIYEIVKKTESSTSKTFKKIGQNIRKDLKNEVETIDTSYKPAPDMMKLKFFNEVDISQATINPNQRVIIYSQVPPTQSTNVNISSTAGNSQVATESENVSISLNINSSSANISANQTTTSISSNAAINTQPANNNVYVMPGYTGSIGCSWPMNEAEFANAKNTIRTKTFEETKLSIAKQICRDKCLLAKQVKEIMLLFEFEPTRLDFAKFAYDYTYDIDNYYLVNDAFEFESSVQELNSYINSRR